MINNAINTAQNVNINYQFAGLGHRIVAFLIDAAVFIIYGIILANTIYKVLAYFDPGDSLGVTIVFTLPIFLYNFYMNVIFNGRTLGKFIMGIKVVKEDGSPANWTDFMVRWILRLVDHFLFIFTVGVVSILFTDKKQRLGDLAAGTIVINTRKSTKVSHVILEDVQNEYKPTFEIVNILSDADMNEIKDIYRLAAESRDYATLKNLRLKIESLLNLKSDLNDGIFVRTIMKDYSYITQGL